MSTDNLYPRHPSTSTNPVADSQLPGTIRPMPSESSTLGGVHHLNQLPDISTNTSKKGGHGAGAATVRKHSVSTSNSTTSAESSTIMTLFPTRGGSIQTTVAGIVGPTAAPPGGAVPGTTNKRGRKPGPLSKSAREAQRRLNHSIIEKARRTKINDALATLKQLVPIDYLQTREMKNAAVDGNDNNEMNEEEGEDEDLDDDDEGGDEEDSEYREHSNRMLASTSVINTKQSSKTNPKGGKKQEKEKEFKLEILVRTVVFLQDLLERVDHLEGVAGMLKTSSNSGAALDQCTTCGNAMSRSPSSFSTTNDKKRKREYASSSPTIEKDLNDEAHEHGQSRSRIKIPRTRADDPPTPRFSPHQQRAEKHMGAQGPRHTASSSPSPSSAENRRLPSISSWLNSDEHGPSPLSLGTFVGTVAGKEGGRNKIIYSPRDNPSTSNATSTPSSYLPSPPPSTHCFDPSRMYTSTQVPFLNLGPGATTTSSSSSAARSPTMSKSLGKSPASVSGSLGSRPPPSSTPPTPLVLTPEDESAASMLLQIASSSSPLFRPIKPPALSASNSSASLDPSRTRSTTTSPSFPGHANTKNILPEPTHFSLYPSHQHPHPHSHPHPQQQHGRPRPLQPQPDHQPDHQHPQTQYDDERSTVSVRQVETPSSMLGIRKY